MTDVWKKAREALGLFMTSLKDPGPLLAALDRGEELEKQRRRDAHHLAVKEESKDILKRDLFDTQHERYALKARVAELELSVAGEYGLRVATERTRDEWKRKAEHKWTCRSCSSNLLPHEVPACLDCFNGVERKALEVRERLETENLRLSAQTQVLREALECWDNWSQGRDFDGKEAERLTRAALTSDAHKPYLDRLDHEEKVKDEWERIAKEALDALRTRDAELVGLLKKRSAERDAAIARAESEACAFAFVLGVTLERDVSNRWVAAHIEKAVTP